MLVLAFLLGSLVTIVLGIASNLLTPGVKPLWAMVVSWGQRGVEAQTRQQIKALQVQLDQLNHFKASDRDLYLYLFRWLLGIMAFLVAGGACAFFAVTGSMTSEERVQIAKLSFLFLLFALACSIGTLLTCSAYTIEGMEKGTAKLEADIAKLRATLPESRVN